ncbi:MAG: hypothetical protein CSYNP_03498 [Syntrophus sp. SKADARSKE-3]|nr:hypothetical protein [Syntrophus sp. SKADARSKE-3]
MKSNSGSSHRSKSAKIFLTGCLVLITAFTSVYALQNIKSILDLQPSRKTSSAAIKNAQGEAGLATLINLNPAVNAWYLLELDWHNGKEIEYYHLENPYPQRQRLLLQGEYPYGLSIADGSKRTGCELWQASSDNSLKKAKASSITYAPLCNGRIYLRNHAKGYRTEIETVSEFLRNEFPGGEKIETFIRDKFFIEGYREKAEIESKTKPSPERESRVPSEISPLPPRVDPRQKDRILASSHPGIDLGKSSAQGISLGVWYPARKNPGIYVSLITANTVAKDIMQSYRNLLRSPEVAEMDSLVYLIAFDLDQFELKYMLGTDHPKVKWSDHILDRMKDRSLPGPDGIGNVFPLTLTGLINPVDASRTAAAFTGGFKRAHGAFKWGALALKNFGSHYGFMEEGVIFSKLQPGLATAYTLVDGKVEMKTWTEDDNAQLPRIRYARQNGVPIISGFDAATKMSVPGTLVSKWGEGNWSGSENRNLRTLRAAVAIQENGGKRFLIYGVFTSATPSAMVRVFQAYQSQYAMPLDMNALELTYLAIYRRENSRLYVQHLIQGMSQVDKSVNGKFIPRFLSYPDNRDYFYLLRKGSQ